MLGEDLGLMLWTGCWVEYDFFALAKRKVNGCEYLNVGDPRAHTQDF